MSEFTSYCQSFASLNCCRNSKDFRAKESRNSMESFFVNSN